MTAVSSMPGANGGQLPAAKPLARASVVPLTIEQYQQMIEDGIVAEDSTVELLRGVMVRKDAARSERIRWGTARFTGSLW